MAPGSERPAGTDAVDEFACACTCGYCATLNTWVESCPNRERHRPQETYEFSCTLVES
jgi:hypothetical protein